MDFSDDFSSINNVESLRLLASDLSRRLENANNTIDAQRQIARNSVAAADRCRKSLVEVSITLRLEISKSDSIRRRKMKEEEAKSFEAAKAIKRAILDELRLAELDYQISPSLRASKKIDAMRGKVKSLAKNYDSQRRLLTHLVAVEKMTEDLSSAAERGDLNACSLLLRQGAGVNDVDSSGFLPLHYACTAGSAEVVKLLCEFGSDPSTYLSGHSSIEMAAKNGHTDVIKILTSFGASVDEKGLQDRLPIISAAENGMLECIVYLVSQGADINGMDHRRNSALHSAILTEDPIALVEFLIRNGADSEVKNGNGETALDIAINTHNSHLIRILGG